MSARREQRDARIVRAEAAAWLARLRSEERTAEDERGFRAWLAESEAHRAAFEVTNSIFEMAGAAERNVVRGRAGGQVSSRQVSRRHVLRAGVGFAAASMAGVTLYLRSGTTYATEIGEQRSVSLEDGTLVNLDTESEIHVSMNEERRRVRLRYGRAHFDVAEDLTRPFQVIAGEQFVTASHGQFDVSRDGALVSVLLEEGPLQIAHESADAGIAAPRTITPGQLVVFAEGKLVREERPAMERAVAWRYGRLAFFEESLVEAVAAMNRYTRRPIVIVDEEVAQMHISGNYSVGDPQAFATSISELLPVEVGVERSRITLRAATSGTPTTTG